MVDVGMKSGEFHEWAGERKARRIGAEEISDELKCGGVGKDVDSAGVSVR